MIDLSIIIVSYNTRELLRNCLKSIYSTSVNNNFEVWVVDNSSKDGSGEMVKKEFPKVRLILNDNNDGFAAGNNLALRKSKAKYYLLLNSDTEVKKGSLDIFIKFALDSNHGISSCRLVNKDGSFQPNGGDLPFGAALINWLFGFDDIPLVKKLFPSFHKTDPEYYSNFKPGWVSGSVFLISEDVLMKIGLMDEDIFMYCEDVDYCVRAKKAGFTIGWTNKIDIMHVGGASSKDSKFRQYSGELRGLIYLYKKYYGSAVSLILKVFIYFAVILRILAFLAFGKKDIAKIYYKVLIDLIIGKNG
jgi:hypothetical protein